MATMTSRENKPAIVVGGGISGLSAAKYLHDRDIPVIVLEAQDRVGGRTFTWRDDSTYGWVDMGGSWVGPTQNHVLRLVKQLGLKTFLCYDELDYVHYSKGKRCAFSSQWPGLWWRNPLAGFDLRYATDQMDSMSWEIPVDRPWEAPKAKEWDSMTVLEFIKKTCWTKDATEYLKANVQTIVVASPDQISLLWYLWYLRSSNGIWRNWNTTNGAQERKICGGSSSISEAMHKILGDKVKLNQVVSHIDQTDDGVTVWTKDGNRYDGSNVIMAVTMPLQLGITYEPPLPALKQQLLQRVSMGTCIKAQLWYENPFWIKHGYNGFITCADGVEFAGNSAVDIRDDNPYPAVTVFVFSEKAAEALEMSKEKRKEAIIASISRILRAPKGEKPIWYTEENFAQNPYLGGCYTAVYPPGVMSTFGHVIRSSHKHIFFGGTETAIEWSGYMNGAVEAGERAAREVLSALGKLPSDSIYEEEPQFDGVPVRPFNKSFLERHPPSVGMLLTMVASSLAVAGGVFLETFK